MTPTSDSSPSSSARPSSEDRLARVTAAIRNVPDFPKPGILFRDITPVLSNGALLVDAVALHLEAIAEVRDSIDAVVGIESRGFLFGMAVASALGKGFVPVRKPGKLPAAVHTESYSLEYGEDALQIHVDALAPGQRVVIIDDLLATGGTALATTRLVQRTGAEVLACLFLVELVALRGRDRLAPVRAASILRY